MIELQVVDKTFSHSQSTVAGLVPKNLIWRRDELDRNAPVVVVNDCLQDLIYEPWPGSTYGLLYESPSIMGRTYDLVPAFIDKLKYLFTPNSSLISQYPDKARYVPGGGVWKVILDKIKQDTFPEKQELVSMLSSSKMMCGLHHYRLNIARILKTTSIAPHVFIQDVGEYIDAMSTLANYRYSIVLENHISETYFTEKILNCFAAGVVPIYLGANKIDYFFDGSGIIKFRSLDQLFKILQSISVEDWEKRIPALKKNKYLALQYGPIEDYMLSQYSEEFGF